MCSSDLKATTIERLPDRPPIGHMNISLNAQRLTPEFLAQIKHLLQTHHGPCPVTLYLRIPNQAVATITLPQSFHVQPTEHCVAEIEALIGDGVVQLQEAVPVEDPAA